MHRFIVTCMAALAAGSLSACDGADAERSARAPAEAQAATAARPAVGARQAPGAAPVAGEPLGGGDAAPSAGSEEIAAAGAPSSAPAAGTPPPAATAAQGGEDATAILQRASRAYEAVRSLEASFTQDLTVPLLDSTQRSRGKLYVRRPDRFALRFTDPAGDLVVVDGRYVWLYYPSSDPKQVMRAPASEGGQSLDFQREFLSNPTERFNAVLNGVESVGGRPAYALTLTPKRGSPYRQVRLWVDRQDALVRRFEITEQNETVRRLELRDLKPNASLSDNLFRFSPPPGVQVFEQ